MSDSAKARILIIDDQAANIQVIAKALTPEFSAEFALSGAQALNKLAGDDLPDLILLDVLMPDMDGYEVCRALKAEPRTREIPVIFITAGKELESDMGAMLALMAGGADFIHKPVNPQVLRQRVRTHVLLRAQEHELQHLRRTLADTACLDPVTNLPNLTLLLDRLSQANVDAPDQLMRFLLVIKLHKLERIQAAVGQPATDGVLCEAARRLRQCAKESRFLARLADGEFILAMDAADQASAMSVAEPILGTLAEPYALGEQKLPCAVSIGLVQPVGMSIDMCLERAHLSMRDSTPGRIEQLRLTAPPDVETSAS